MSDDEALAGAMEVFNTTIQQGSTGAQGQQDSSGVLDRTASGAQQSSGQVGTASTDGSGQPGQAPGTTGTGQSAGGTGTGSVSVGTIGLPGLPGLPGQGGGTTGTGPTTTGTGTGTSSGTAGSAGQDGTVAGLPGGSGTGRQSGSSGRTIIISGSGGQVMTEQERVEAMDRDLNESMGVFDGVILSRRQEVIARTNENDAGQMGGGSASGGMGNDAGSITPPLLTGGRGGNEDPNNNQTAGTLPDAQSDSRQGEYRNQGTNANVPADISDGSDDDIVARQLREAAMQEKDPALREKLWNEYRKYKEGVQAKR